MRALLVLAIALLIPLASAGMSDTCVRDVEGELSAESPAGVHYLWIPDCEDCVIFWIYEESNRLDGLQVEEFWFEGAVCYPYWMQPDTIIF